KAGAFGNLTLLPNYRLPPLYYLKKDRIWQYVNDTTVFPLNVLNVTASAAENRHPPFQLTLGRKIEGVEGGLWRWSGSMLYYDFPGKTETQGLFFMCENNRINGVFMYCQQCVHLF
ncbi:hypothetical protein FA15DRAFT_574575, partial [Coprinopsis marcescibilis]